MYCDRLVMTNSYEPVHNVFSQAIPGAFGLEFLKKLIMTTENITITKTEYDKLLNAAEKLARLERGGVDNWEWYGESLARQEGDDFRSKDEAEDVLTDNDIDYDFMKKTFAPYSGEDQEIISARDYLIEFHGYTEVEA